MILAAQQPCYLPATDFFYKMSLSDVFVLADDVRFTTNADINRAKIKTAQGECWLTVPVFTKRRGGQFIHQVEIDNLQNWRDKHWKTLRTTYAYAAYFDLYADFFEEMFHSKESPITLIELNLVLIDYLRIALNLNATVVRSSALNVCSTGADWIFEIADAMGADTYLANATFSKYLSKKVFAERGLHLNFVEMPAVSYYQQFGDFIPGMSIVDLLFNEGERSREILLGKVP